MKSLKHIAEAIFEEVEKDLKSRLGFSEAWDEMDYHVEEEVRKTNSENILALLKREFGEKG